MNMLFAMLLTVAADYNYLRRHPDEYKVELILHIYPSKQVCKRVMSHRWETIHRCKRLLEEGFISKEDYDQIWEGYRNWGCLFCAQNQNLTYSARESNLEMLAKKVTPGLFPIINFLLY